MSIALEIECGIGRFMGSTGRCSFGCDDLTDVAAQRMARACYIDAGAARRPAAAQVRAEGPSFPAGAWLSLGTVPDDAGLCIDVAHTLSGAHGCSGWPTTRGAQAPDFRQPMRYPRMADGEPARHVTGDRPRPVGPGAMGGAAHPSPDACETAIEAPIARAIQEADANRSAATGGNAPLHVMDGPRERPAKGDGAATRHGTGNPFPAILDAATLTGGNAPQLEVGRAAPGTGKATGTGP
ncbi:MAG: hypothetical protein V2I65_13005 [Paracoccaceae bacterium]|nr:hypothetical protein [Paracoccaceae bacterium]